MIIVSAVFNEGDNSIQVTMDTGKILSVPVSTDNRHYVMVQEWVRQGNTIAPYVPPVKTRAEKIADILRDTETDSITARKLEDIMDNLINSTPLPQEADDWLTDRQTKRGSIT